MKKLSNSNITGRPKMPIRVLQFGGGNFLRAFANQIIQELNEEAEFDAGVAIVKPTEHGIYRDLIDQDGLYHVVLRGVNNGQYNESIKRIDCIQTIVHPYHQWNEYLQLAEHRQMRFIISNTTEAGIKFNSDDQVQGGPYCEYPGKLLLWLHHRYTYFEGDPAMACILLPMELVEQNGRQLKNCLLDYCTHWHLDKDFISWLDYNIFCDTLVDRIVSGYPTNEVSQLEKKIGYQDKLIVVGEQYHSWVIYAPSDISHELPIENTDLNVQFVDDLEIHRKIKVRFLNGAHTSLVPIGYLSGYQTVREVIRDQAIRTFIIKELSDEILPTIDHDKQVLEKYIKDVIDRFDNPTLEHKLLDIALNSISKFRVRLLPSLLDYHDRYNEVSDKIVFALAALIRLYRGILAGGDIPLRDNPDYIRFFEDIWKQYNGDLKTLTSIILKNENLWGQDLTKVDGLHQRVTLHLQSIVDQLNRNQKVILDNKLQ